MMPSRKHWPIGGHDHSSRIAISNVLEHLREFQQKRTRQRVAMFRAVECDCHDVSLTFNKEMMRVHRLIILHGLWLYW
jgi:hypothetical protein